MHPAANPYQAQAVSTAAPAQLVSMLYDRALVAIARSRRAADQPGPASLETMNVELQRAQDIVTELQLALDHDQGGQIASSLDALYTFCLERLITANITKDIAELAPVERTIGDLRDAWDQACCAVPAGVA
ncbi:MAG: flagellar export chaperone FliS [Nitriliruptor sp.]|uniref:flagellar export chaperone FliS n=1 Tax=Nitriliruptor sp. TaxID=2448056 RepID=UPI0034A06123